LQERRHVAEKPRSSSALEAEAEAEAFQKACKTTVKAGAARQD
jgi:hypothetical protein